MVELSNTFLLLSISTRYAIGLEKQASLRCSVSGDLSSAALPCRPAAPSLYLHEHLAVEGYPM